MDKVLLEEKIYVTKEYDKFKFLSGNRIADNRQVCKMKKALMQKNMLSICPVLVNEKMEIIDGQHRLLASRELGVEVPYKIQDRLGIKEVQIINQNQKNWAARDFADSFATLGNGHYKIYREFQDKWGFGHIETMYLLSGGKTGKGTADCELFKDGEFKVKQARRAEKMAVMLKEFEPFCPKFWKMRSCVLALLQIFEVPKYCHSTMLHKVKCNPSLVVKCSTTSDFKLMFERVYNYRTPTNKKLRFV